MGLSKTSICLKAHHALTTTEDSLGLAVRQRIHVPLVASSGAGAVEHFVDVFVKTKVEAALAAGVFHRGEISIPELKRTLRVAGVEVRPS